MLELVDRMVSKTIVRKDVRVRVPLSVKFKSRLITGGFLVIPETNLPARYHPVAKPTKRQFYSLAPPPPVWYFCSLLFRIFISIKLFKRPRRLSLTQPVGIPFIPIIVFLFYSLMRRGRT